MAPTLVASYFVQQNTTAATALTTPSFTPSNGEVIVVKLGTWSTSISMGTPTGGGLTYTSQVINAPGGFNSWCGIYTAIVSGSPGSMTVSSTPSASARYSMTVERWSGAQLAATPVTNSLASTGAAASTITPTAGTSVISWCSADAQSVDPSTRAYLGSGVDEGVRDGHVGANGVEYYGYQLASGTSSQSYGLSAPTGQTFVIAGIEVQAASATAPTVPPNQQVRRRLSAPRMARVRSSTPVRSQVNPPLPVAAAKQPRRPRGLPRLFRGRFAAPVPPQTVLAAPPYPPQPVRTRLRGLRMFRGRSAAPVPAQIVVTPPSWVPSAVRVRLKGLLAARSRRSAPPVDQALAPPAPRGRPHSPAPRRGHTAAPPQTQIAPTPPAYPPRPARGRPKGLRPDRGRQGAAPVPPQIVVTPPPYPPSLTRAKERLARLWRGATRFVPVSSAAPVISPRTPTVVVDLARPTAVADLSRTTATADLTRPSVPVAL